ncbi:hypothetical protein MGWOODY_Smn1142 [hydrothermal vent metagenome]|uniref:Uncharacterized protein n=1 Tax=hydrothermal vent metagenome TaxID=652676 RepID=A0A160TNP6_9ZZZZ
MFGKRWLSLVGAVFAAFAAMLIVAPAMASETTVYAYDALGRLITATVAGGPAGGTQTGTVFDPAGNRKIYTVSGVSGGPAFSINNVTTTDSGAVEQGWPQHREADGSRHRRDLP